MHGRTAPQPRRLRPQSASSRRPVSNSTQAVASAAYNATTVPAVNDADDTTTVPAADDVNTASHASAGSDANIATATPGSFIANSALALPIALAAPNAPPTAFAPRIASTTTAIRGCTVPQPRRP
jgi:hypothetical protein